MLKMKISKRKLKKMKLVMIDDGIKEYLCMTYWFFLHEQSFKNTFAKNMDQNGMLFNLPRPKWSVAI